MDELDHKLKQVGKAAKQLTKGLAVIKEKYPYTEKDKELVPRFKRMRMWNGYYLVAVELYREEMVDEIVARK